VVMFSAIVTGMLGFWGLGLLGVIDTSLVYFMPTYLVPVAIGGLLFGVGMVVGGYCPGTAVASMVTGKIDAVIFFIGFLIGSLIFGDFFPLWSDFFQSDYRGVFRLDQVLNVSLGLGIFFVVVIAIAGSLFLRFVQRQFWPLPDGLKPESKKVLGVEGILVAIAFVLGLVMAFFPNSDYIADSSKGTPYYIIPQASAAAVSTADSIVQK